MWSLRLTNPGHTKISNLSSKKLYLPPGHSPRKRKPFWRRRTKRIFYLLSHIDRTRRLINESLFLLLLVLEKSLTCPILPLSCPCLLIGLFIGTDWTSWWTPVYWSYFFSAKIHLQFDQKRDGLTDSDQQTDHSQLMDPRMPLSSADSRLDDLFNSITWGLYFENSLNESPLTFRGKAGHTSLSSSISHLDRGPLPRQDRTILFFLWGSSQ